MQYKRFRFTSIVLLVVAFVMPLLATMLLSSRGRPEDHQYDVIQFVVMAIYNLPFVIVSFVALIASIIFKSRYKQNPARVAQVV